MGMMWTVGPGTFRPRSVHLGMVLNSVSDPNPDPDPHVFGPPGFGSTSQRIDPDPALDLDPSIIKHK
jgi:hypothetical protein